MSMSEHLFSVYVVAISASMLTLEAVHAKQFVATDQSISDKIEDEMIWEPGVSPIRIDISTTDGIVTLNGQVNSLLAKERAVRIAETVKGVRTVIDKIEVDPTVVLDDMELKAAIERALLTDPATDSYSVRLTVSRGIVTLHGEVDSYRERELAATVVKGVKGVRLIDNRMSVDYTRTRADSTMEEEIEQSLKWNTLVDDGLITVKVQDAKATLTGQVGSAAERTQAELDCWVAGIKEVDVTGLEVAGWMRDDKLRGSKNVARTDDEIRDAIEDALTHDPRVHSFKIDVEVDAGTVTLRGEVDNLKAQRTALGIARHTAGAYQVKDRVKVRPVGSYEDAEIVKGIRDAMQRDPFIDRFEITTVIRDGVAHLYGEVDSYFEKGQADDVASRVNGVRYVENHLQVDRDLTASAYNPYWHDYDIHDYDWYDYQPHHTATTDPEIEEAIESELWWSPFVNSNEVQVVVDNGIASLSGQVASYSEKQAAEENAWQGGATWVNNEIDVQFN